MRTQWGLVLACVCGCDPAQRRAQAVEEDWPGLLDGTYSVAIYAPAYVAPPPMGEFLRISLHRQGALACDAYRKDFELPGTESFVRLTTNRFQRGRFRVVEQVSESEELQVEVRAIRSRAGIKAESYRANEGFLDLTSAPTDRAGSLSDALVGGQLHAGFPLDPIVGSECSSSGDKRGATLSSECRCTHSSGVEEHCTPDDPERSCCVTHAPAALFLDVPIQARLCGALCAFTQPELAAYCTALQ